jgi:prepilin-type N-terminal cleavage/methylation domain-containing protein
MLTKPDQRPTPRNRSRAFSRPGFSLIELVLVLFIAGILGAIAAPRVWATNGRARAHASAKRVAADLEYARSQAVTTSAPVTVYFSAARSAYGIPGWNSPLDSRQTTYVVDLSASPFQSSIAAVSFGDAASTRWSDIFEADPVQKVVFDGFGKPDSSGWLVVSSAGILYAVALDVSGRATYAEVSRATFDTGVSNFPSGTIAIGEIR